MRTVRPAAHVNDSSAGSFSSFTTNFSFLFSSMSPTSPGDIVCSTPCSALLMKRNIRCGLYGSGSITLVPGRGIASLSALVPFFTQIFLLVIFVYKFFWYRLFLSYVILSATTCFTCLSLSLFPLLRLWRTRLFLSVFSVFFYAFFSLFTSSTSIAGSLSTSSFHFCIVSLSFSFPLLTFPPSFQVHIPGSPALLPPPLCSLSASVHGTGIFYIWAYTPSLSHWASFHFLTWWFP